MKYIGRILAIVLALGLTSGKAQQCTFSPIWEYPGETPSILGLITGNYQRPSSETWEFWAKQQTGQDAASLVRKSYAHLHGGNSMMAKAKLLPLLDSARTDSLEILAQASAFEAQGFAEIALSQYQEAALSLEIAQQITSGATRCRVRTVLLLARYLDAYGDNTPIWPHFNGGFFNYLSDSLGWKAKAPDPDGYVMALNVVGWMLRIDVERAPLYLELLGDLLSKEPGKFNSHYLAGLAYMRAGILAEDARSEVFERKGIFALEAPNIRDDRFNQYRWTQLRKALTEDVSLANSRIDSITTLEAANAKNGKDPLLAWGGKTSNAPISAAFFENEIGRLPSLLVRSRAQIEGPAAAAGPYAGDVDLKKVVKKDTRFNIFAIFLILTIVAAVVFFWVQLRKSSRQQS